MNEEAEERVREGLIEAATSAALAGWYGFVSWSDVAELVGLSYEELTDIEGRVCASEEET